MSQNKIGPRKDGKGRVRVINNRKNGSLGFQGWKYRKTIAVGQPGYGKVTDRDMLQTETNWKILPTFIRRCVSVGSSATILAGTTVLKSSIVEAGEVIAKGVFHSTMVSGNPAKILRTIMRQDG